jgi:16S rRNA (adenine1518-N6/adenine1519-N6)-dimethyltransferase
MAEASGCTDIGVIEIGTGVGVLTVELCKRAKKVVCIEIDTRLKPILDKTLKDFDNCEVIFEDVMKVDLAALIKDKFGDMPVVVCANLPYYITSPIIMMLLESRLPINAITVMVQKEAADRLTAEVGSRESGAVTVAVDYYAKAETVRKVSRGSFMPSPNVDSAVIRLDLRKEPPAELINEKAFFKLVRAGFNQRRKTLQNSVSSALGISKDTLKTALEYSGLAPTVRAEALTMQELCTLSNEIEKLK